MPRILALALVAAALQTLPGSARADAVAAVPMASVASVAAPAALDLHRMRAKLSRTRAIGLRTKLEIRTQVNSLVDRIATIPARDARSWSQARARFDALLDDVIERARSDAALVSALETSREALWEELVLHSRGHSLAALRR